MVFRLLALLLLPVIAFYITRSISQRLHLSGRNFKLLFGLMVVVLVIAVMVVLGRLPVQFILAPLGVATTFLLRLLPTLIRLIPMWHMFKGRAGIRTNKEAGQASTIRTQMLEMELFHDTGDMDGQVLQGEFAGRKLSSLSLDELLMLLRECGQDVDSSQVLEAYLDRNQADWREQCQRRSSASANAEESQMTRALALEILGLEGSTDRDTIVRAHRSLMQKLHPDRGGSDYLAKKINAAKDYLLRDQS